MQKEIQAEINDEMKRLDDLYLQQGDVLDVKASIILVVVTFMGTLSGQLIVISGLPFFLKIMQVTASITLCAVVIVTILVLWPRDFKAPAATDQWSHYSEELEKHFERVKDAPAQVLLAFQMGKRKATMERIANNKRLIDRKSELNLWAFRGTVLALVLESITLMYLAFWRLFGPAATKPPS